MVKKKIVKIIVSNKIKINNYLNNEKVIVINDIEREALKQKLISVSFNDYLKKKINCKNMMYSIMICMICIVGALRLLFGALINDPKILALIADPCYLTGDRVLISITLAAFVVSGVKMRMVYISSKYSIFNYLSSYKLALISIRSILRN